MGKARFYMRGIAYGGERVFSIVKKTDPWQIAAMSKTDCVDILKAHADRTRMRLTKALLEEEHGVNDLAAKLRISQYNASKHLRILRQAGIVDVRAIGTRREYFIAQPFRERLQKEGHTLDFGCCSFRFDQLPG